MQNNYRKPFHLNIFLIFSKRKNGNDFFYFKILCRFAGAGNFLDFVKKFFGRKCAKRHCCPELILLQPKLEFIEPFVRNSSITVKRTILVRAAIHYNNIYYSAVLFIFPPEARRDITAIPRANSGGWQFPTPNCAIVVDFYRKAAIMYYKIPWAMPHPDDLPF